MRGSASAIIRRGAFILLLLSAGRSMSSTIKCLLKEGALVNVGECSILSTRSLNQMGIQQTLVVGSLGETLRVTEEAGKVHLQGIAYWNDRPPLRHRTSFGITDLLRELLRAFVSPGGPHHPKKKRQQ